MKLGNLVNNNMLLLLFYLEHISEVIEDNET